ncbi:MAG TPA: maleylpyruvate isomerase N-terminal domain-containing protein [Actinospica sp.]|nr:maleylpyruvate isomerase N-terminal domain-containing protein [Actinospica sp.]
MWSVTPDRQAVSDAFAKESERNAGLVRGCRDLRDPVPGLDWNVGQLAAHLTAVYMVFGAAMSGGYQDTELTAAVTAADGAGGLPATIAAANEYAVGVLAAPSPASAADGIAANAAVLLEALARQEDLALELETPWYGVGMTRNVGTLASLAVTESLVHGRDLARAVRAGTRMSQDSAAAATPTVMSAMLPLLFDADRAKGLRADYEVRVRGGARFLMRIADGTAESLEAGPGAARTVDCVISLDPRAALLIGFGRSTLARAILNGGALSCGRRPWLGLRFNTLFATP